MEKNIVLIALFAAIIAALGFLPKVTLASGIPITAQSMGIMLVRNRFRRKTWRSSSPFVSISCGTRIATSLGWSRRLRCLYDTLGRVFIWLSSSSICHRTGYGTVAIG